MPHILVVDDNPRNVLLITDILESQDYKVESASDGASGLEQAYRSKPDLILMDVQMPGMSGTEAMKILKADDAVRMIPVVAVTALAMSDDEEQLLSQGFDGYLSKPISFRSLLTTVNRFLS